MRNFLFLKTCNLLGRMGGIFLEEEDEQTKAENDAKRKEFEQEKIDLAKEAEKQKSEDLWADFKSDAPSSSIVPKKPKSSGGLGFLTSMNKPVKKAVPPPKTKAFSKPKSSIDSLFESLESGTSTSMAGGKIEPETEKNVVTEKPQNSLIGSIFENIKKSNQQSANKPQEEKVENENDQDDGSKIMKITKVFDFAGETVEVTKEVEKDSKEAKQFQKSQEKQQAQKRPGGLNSIMGTISGKAPKMGTLDKSKLDWNKFVNEEGIKEELVTHNRGKDGYVEKQQFLERADVRRFEIEKSAREKSRKTLNR